MLSGGRLGCTNRLSTPWSGLNDAGEAILKHWHSTGLLVRRNVRFGLTSSQNRVSRRDRFSDRAQEDSVSGDFTISPHCSCDVDCFISCPLFSNSCYPEPECYRLRWNLLIPGGSGQSIILHPVLLLSSSFRRPWLSLGQRRSVVGRSNHLYVKRVSHAVII